jgi:hypothetical protein
MRHIFPQRVSLPAIVSAIILNLVLAATTLADQPLTNDDVVQLMKLGLGDDVVVAKIKQAPTAAFKLSPDDLANLKKAGASDKVIAAMLEKATPTTPSARPMNELEAAWAAQRGANRSPMPGQVQVELVDSAGARPLPWQNGDMSETNYLVGVIMWFNVHDAHAATRTADKAAFLRIQSQTRIDEVGSFVKLDSNKEDRSLKIGNINALSFRTDLGGKPDKGWIIQSTIKEEPPGVWELHPKKPLPRGEYGFYTLYGIATFGID